MPKLQQRIGDYVFVNAFFFIKKNKQIFTASY